MKNTSLIAFNKIQKSGFLSESRLRIYRAIVYNPKQTANEIFKNLGLETNNSGRLSELQELDCIKEFEQRPCSVTGNTAISWISTENSPKEKTKKPTKKERTEKALELFQKFHYKFESEEELTVITNAIKDI